MDYERPAWRDSFDSRTDVDPVRDRDGFAFRASYEDRVAPGWGQYPSVLVLTTTTQGAAEIIRANGAT